MIWSPDLRIAAEQPRLPMLVTSTVTGARREATAAEAYRPRAKATEGCPTPRLQWRDRVGLTPTSHDHQEASN